MHVYVRGGGYSSGVKADYEGDASGSITKELPSALSLCKAKQHGLHLSQFECL